MKFKLFILSILLASTAITKAQTSNAIFFTENGEKFNLVLNGILQNEKAETNVKLTGLNAPSYKTRVLFADKSLGMVDYTLNFVDMGAEVTYTIKKNSKGAYVVRYVSEVPLAQAPPSAPNQTVVVYSTPPMGAETTTTRQTTTTTTGNPDNVSINMGVNVDGHGGGVNMNVSGMDGNMESSSTTTTTTTHTTTTTYQDPPPPPPPHHEVYVDGYNGKIGCPVPMSRGDFDSFKSSLTSKSFEDSKMTLAKQVLNNNCLTSSQVREVMGLFSFEQTKLDFAKYAYGHTYDLGNFYKVNDAFGFESSIDDLNNYINSQR